MFVAHSGGAEQLNESSGWDCEVGSWNSPVLIEKQNVIMISFMSLQASPKLGVVKGDVLRSVQAHLWPWCSQRHPGTYPASPSRAQTGWEAAGPRAGLCWTPWNSRDKKPQVLLRAGKSELWAAGQQEGRPGCPCPFPILFSSIKV